MKLTCRDCGKSFVFSEKEQAFFTQKKWKDPVRCPLCREKNKNCAVTPTMAGRALCTAGGADAVITRGYTMHPILWVVFDKEKENGF